MPASRKYVAVVCAAAAAGAVLAGCDDGEDKGSGPLAVPMATVSAKAAPFADLTALQLLKKAEKDMRDAGALTYEMSGTDDGLTAHEKVSVTSGGACRGAMNFDGAKAQFVVPGDGADTYLKAGSDFWSRYAGAPAGTARRLAATWVKIPASKVDGGELAQMCDLDSFMALLAEGDGEEGTTLTKGAPTTLDGKQVLPLVQTDAEDATTTIYVSTGATPYVLRAVDDDPPAVIAFTGFGKAPHISAPPRGQTLDLKDVDPGGGLHI